MPLTVETILSSLAPMAPQSFYKDIPVDFVKARVAEIFSKLQPSIVIGSRWGTYHNRILIRLRNAADPSRSVANCPILFHSRGISSDEYCVPKLSSTVESTYSLCLEHILAGYKSCAVTNIVLLQVRASKTKFEYCINPAVTVSSKRKEVTRRCIVWMCRLLFPNLPLLLNVRSDASSSKNSAPVAAPVPHSPPAAASSSAPVAPLSGSESSSDDCDTSDSGPLAADIDSNDGASDDDGVSPAERCLPSGTCQPNPLGVCQMCSNKCRPTDILFIQPQVPQAPAAQETRPVPPVLAPYLFYKCSVTKEMKSLVEVPYVPFLSVHFGFSGEISTHRSLIALFPELVFQKKATNHMGSGLYSLVPIPCKAIVSWALIPQDDTVTVARGVPLSDPIFPRSWAGRGDYLLDMFAGRGNAAQYIVNLEGTYPGGFNDLGSRSQLGFRGTESRFLPKNLIMVVALEAIPEGGVQLGVRYDPSYWGLRSYATFDRYLSANKSVFDMPGVKACVEKRRALLKYDVQDSIDNEEAASNPQKRRKLQPTYCQRGLLFAMTCIAVGWSLVPGSDVSTTSLVRRCTNIMCKDHCIEFGTHACVIHKTKGTMPPYKDVSDVVRSALQEYCLSDSDEESQSSGSRELSDKSILKAQRCDPPLDVSELSLQIAEKIPRPVVQLPVQLQQEREAIAADISEVRNRISALEKAVSHMSSSLNALRSDLKSYNDTYMSMEKLPISVCNQLIHNKS